MRNHFYSYLTKKYYIRSSSAFKKVIHRACHCSIGWPNSWIIWERQSHTWGFYWFIQGLWPCNIIKKLENYEIKCTNFAWFRNYSTNRKQYIQITNDSKSHLRNTTFVPQGSFLGPLLFAVYVNFLQSSSKILNPIMFAEETNLFYEHKNIIKFSPH